MFSTTDLQLIFQGDIWLALEGNEPLIPFEYSEKGIQAFYIGSKTTDLIIRDHRFNYDFSSTSQDQDQEKFFSYMTDKPAWVEIRYQEPNEVMEIDLFNSNKDGELPILWVGILEGNQMPAYKVEWELYKELNAERTAFAAFIP